MTKQPRTIVNVIKRLMTLALQQKTHEVFIEYAPHVEQIEFRVYLNGWKDRADPDYKKIVYLLDDDIQTADVLNHLNAVEDTLTKILSK